MRKLFSETFNKESVLFGVSVRAWLVVIMTATVCNMAVQQLEVKEPLYSGFLIGIGFYLGTKSRPPADPPPAPPGT